MRTQKQRSEQARKAAAARWKRPAAVDKKKSTALDLPKLSEAPYTRENLVDAKKSEALDLLVYINASLAEWQAKKMKLHGARLESASGVNEMMIGGRIMELTELAAWICRRHDVEDGVVIDA